jgi:hypothetical protein
VWQAQTAIRAAVRDYRHSGASGAGHRSRPDATRTLKLDFELRGTSDFEFRNLELAFLGIGTNAEISPASNCNLQVDLVIEGDVRNYDKLHPGRSGGVR